MHPFLFLATASAEETVSPRPRIVGRWVIAAAGKFRGDIASKSEHCAVTENLFFFLY